MSLFYLIGAAVAVGTWVFAIVASAGRIAVFMNVPSLVVVLVPAAGLCLSSFRPQEIGRSFRVAFARSPAQATELRVAAAFFRALQRYLLLTGPVGGLVGLIVMLASLGDVSGQGIGLALCLLTVLYSVLLALLLALPFRAAVERRLAELGEPAE